MIILILILILIFFTNCVFYGMFLLLSPYSHIRICVPTHDK